MLLKILSAPHALPRLLACCLTAGVMAQHASAQGYNALSLRGDLSPLPYYATSGGRDGKRFVDEAVNRYRIYDFYSRQAEYHLANPGDNMEPLPPFPELDGGRRGHWGGTNDRESGAYDRPEGPDFTTVTSRLGKGLFHVLAGPAENPSLIVFNGITNSLEGFYPAARLSVPKHYFGFAVDRFGFRLEISGTSALSGASGEWSRDGRKVGRFSGYYIQGDSAVFRSEIDGVRLLERPTTIVGSAGAPRLLSRDFQFSAAMDRPVDFSLPVVSGVAKEIPTTWTAEQGMGNSIIIRGQAGDRVCLHRVIVAGGVKVEPQPQGGGVRVISAPAAGRFVVMSWGGMEKDAGAAREALAAQPAVPSGVAPDSCLGGSPSRFPKTVKVSGVLNADPACRESAYVIDDIPVPVEDNPYRCPMTLSGLAFSGDGTAYASTLVGDVWKITGLEGYLRNVEWKRYASGLDLPMGVEVVDGVPYVNVKRFVLRLVDLNGDGEADLYERFNRDDIPYVDESGHDLQRDAAGNFYFNSTAGIFRLSADGGTLAKVGEGSRNPLGMGVRKDGLVLSDSSEGDHFNGTCSIYESDHPENKGTTANRHRILYRPRGVDNSPGRRVFMDEPRFGPLGRSIVGMSYAAGTWYYLVCDPAEGTPQAAMVTMPGSFASGSCRGAVQPRDGQLFVAGLDGWGDYATREGCLHRIRWTGRETTVLAGWRGCRNGLLLEFNQPLAAELPKPDRWFVQEWNYVDSEKSYGSPEYSVKSPGVMGHDRLRVGSVARVSDRAVFLEIPDILPAMCLQVHTALRDAGERAVQLDAYFTLNHLMADHTSAVPAPGGKMVVLEVPQQAANGDTYQNVVDYFDRLYGRATAGRAESTPLALQGEKLTYTWLKKNLIQNQCMPCHGAGTQHDFSTYEGLIKKVDLKNPGRSPILGMLQTKSMPPYPLPSVPKSTLDLVRDWIQQGAPQ